MNFAQEDPLCKELKKLSLSGTFEVLKFPLTSSNNGIYRVFMNPKNISSLKIEANSTIAINDEHILTVWPNISCPFNCITSSKVNFTFSCDDE